MTWNDITRPQYERKSDRYASDLTDGEWTPIELYISPPSATGYPRRWPLREIVDAISYIASSGCLIDPQNIKTDEIMRLKVKG